MPGFIPAAYDMLPGASHLDIINFAQSDPGAGNLGANFALDGGFWWAVQWCSFRLICGAAAANRLPGLVLGVGAQPRVITFVATQVAVALSANDVMCCEFSANAPAASSNMSVPIGIFPVLGPGVFKVSCGNFQAGDQLVNIAGALLRWKVG